MLRKVYINLKKGCLNIKVAYSILRKSRFENNSSVAGIVFSMDRPMQLFALLESYYRLNSTPERLYILYKASTHCFEKGYNEVVESFKDKDLVFIKETNFRDDLLEVLSEIDSEFIFFLVDDIIFTRSYSLNDFLCLENRNKYILSLRLGENLDYCYTRQQPQKLPKFKGVAGFRSWNWSEGEHDWNYIFSVDGHVYNRFEILEMSRHVFFKAPNSYESSMNLFRFLLRKKEGLCYQSSVLVNACINRVQNEVSNISGGVTALEMQKLWSSNQKIDISSFNNLNNRSAHVEINTLSIISRQTSS